MNGDVRDDGNRELGWLVWASFLVDVVWWSRYM
jgi:hypothetical protein